METVDFTRFYGRLCRAHSTASAKFGSPSPSTVFTVLGYQGYSVNAVVLVELPKIPLLANKKSQSVHGISSLSQVMGLAAYKLRPVIRSVHGLTLVPEYPPRNSTHDEQ
jgi:hypothetical protein